MRILAHTTSGVARRAVGRRVLPALGVLLCLVASAAVAETIPKGDVTIKLEPVAAGLTAPVMVTHAGDGSGRLFVVEQSGQIRIVRNGNVLPTPFLDISGKLPALNAFFDERGLLGLAFHPDYASNGRFFVRYSAPRAGAMGEPCFGTSRGCHTEVLAEYAVSADPDVADPSSERILFAVDEPQFNHDGGHVAFGPDGFLYFSLGDGGGAHDGLADTPPSHGPIGHGQNIDTALGAMLRIDVDGAMPYGIPPDNPFVGRDGLDEIFAYGMRNPYRFSFDDGPGGTGRLFLGDVGQNLFEEIDIVVNGGNYGWVVREGAHCFDPFNPRTPPAACSGFGPLGEPLIDPIFEYAHPGTGFSPEGGITVIGGHVYRGARSPALDGRYVFGDFAQAFVVPSGKLYYLDESSSGDFSGHEFAIGADDRPYGLFLKGFGEDESGEVLACGTTALAPFGDSGVIERIVAVNNPTLDVKPGSCRNPLQLKAQGVLPVAIVGTEHFDVSEIDLSSIALTRGGSILAFSASLDGAGTGSTASGRAFMTLNVDTNEFTMDLTFSGLLGTQTVQHVHGPASTSQNGPVIFGIPGPGSFENFSIVLTDEQKQVILDGLAYINIHSTRNPGGEIRGQILPARVAPSQVAVEDVATPSPGDPCACDEAGADGIPDLSLKFDRPTLASVLSLDVTEQDHRVVLQIVGRQRPASVAGRTIFNFGIDPAQEVPSRTSAGRGSCTVELDESSGDVSVGCSFENLVGNPIAAHIHGPAAPGMNAGVIVPLTVHAPSGTITGGGTLSPALVDAMLAGLTYVNLHTDVFPPGELRGQIAGGEAFAASDCIEVIWFRRFRLGPHAEIENTAAPAPAQPRAASREPRSEVRELRHKLSILESLGDDATPDQAARLAEHLRELRDEARASGQAELVEEVERVLQRVRGR